MIESADKTDPKTARIASPLGTLTVTESNSALTRLSFVAGDPDPIPPESDLLKETSAQLAAYFAGTRTSFDLPLEPAGSTFQQSVYREMSAIPFGETRRYGELAKRLNVAAQPIGQACGSNPIPIIIPCHRVLGATSLGGFSAPGGVETKVALLKHEGAAGLLL